MGIDWRREHCAHLMVYLTSAVSFRYVTAIVMRKFWDDLGFIVFSCDRPALKHEGESLGDKFPGGMIHVNVRPLAMNQLLGEAPWPPFISVQPHRGVQSRSYSTRWLSTPNSLASSA